MIDRIFFAHPRSVSESYGEHLMVAGGFGLTMIGAGLACMIHAIVPAMFVKTGSGVIENLHRRMVRNRRQLPAPASASSISTRKEST